MCGVQLNTTTTHLTKRHSNRSIISTSRQSPCCTRSSSGSNPRLRRSINLITTTPKQARNPRCSACTTRRTCTTRTTALSTPKASQKVAQKLALALRTCTRILCILWDIIFHAYTSRRALVRWRRSPRPHERADHD